MKTAQLSALAQSFAFQCDRIALSCEVGKTTPRGYANSDVKSIQKWANVAVLDYCEGIDAQAVRNINPMKGVKRLSQALNFIATNDTATGKTGTFEPSTAYIVAVVALATQKVISYQNINFLMTRKGSDDSVHIKGVSQSRLQRLLKAVHTGTAGTRISSAIGKSGFLTNLGIVKQVSKHEIEILDSNHPVILGYCAALQRVSEGDFDMLLEKVAA